MIRALSARGGLISISILEAISRGRGAQTATRVICVRKQSQSVILRFIFFFLEKISFPWSDFLLSVFSFFFFFFPFCLLIFLNKFRDLPGGKEKFELVGPVTWLF